jgi:hypothetical protein
MGQTKVNFNRALTGLAIVACAIIAGSIACAQNRTGVSDLPPIPALLQVPSRIADERSLQTQRTALLGERQALRTQVMSDKSACSRVSSDDASAVAECYRVAAQLRLDLLAHAQASIRFNGLITDLQSSSPEVAHRIDNERQTYTLLTTRYDRLYAALQKVNAERDRQRANLAEQERLRWNITQDMVIDALGAMTDQSFLGALGAQLDLSTATIGSLRSNVTAVRDGLVIASGYDAALAADANPNDRAVSERLRAKTISTASTIILRGTRSEVPPDVRTDFEKLVKVGATDAIAIGKPPKGSDYQQLAGHMDHLASIVAAVLPPVASLRSAVNATGGAIALYVIRDDAQTIRMAVDSLDHAHEHLVSELRTVDQARMDLRHTMALQGATP